MALRRLVDQIREHNWLVVAIEFVIVAMGVFLGLQASNWNEARIDRAIAAGHLAEIAEDLQAHLDFHEKLYGSAVARISAAEYLLRAAGRPTPPPSLVVSVNEFTVPVVPPVPPDRLDNLLGSLNLVRVTVSARNGYESLISSGNLGLIENRDLARKIQQYYGRYDDLLDTQKVFREFRAVGVGLGYRYGLSAFDERPAEEVVAIVRDHDDFAAYVRTTREWAIAHASLLEDLRAETEVLLAMIRRELDKPS
jgi:hypothetical protein